MKLFFDTETTGLVNWKLPFNDASQPSLIQLGLILTEDDGTVRRTLGLIFKRNDIPIEASNVHGITNEISQAYGINASDEFKWQVADMFHNASEIIAHNYAFDKVVLNKFLDGIGTLNDSKSFCTMLATTDICKLPHKSPRRWPGQGAYKWPKCSEAYEHLFNEKLEGAHDALTDVRACMRIYFELKHLQLTHESMLEADKIVLPKGDSKRLGYK